MAFFAVDNDDLIAADDAEPEKIYWCMECFGPVKRRKAKRKFAHFYHVKTSSSCRLYSKSEDHLIAQMELQRLFPKDLLKVERPFIEIDRVADACWEEEKIVFEIQCSQITEKEAEMRIRDYQIIGYDVIWLLSDKIFNKRICRPAEKILRTSSAYYLSLSYFYIYDQFEIFSDIKRVRKSRPMSIDITRTLKAPEREFSEDLFPTQISRLCLNRHFYGDRLSRALYLPQAMLYWRGEEIRLSKKPNPIGSWFKKHLIEPYFEWLEKRLKEY